MVTAKGETPFDSEVVQPSPASPAAQETAVAVAMMTQENISINQVLYESIQNSNSSLNKNILINVCNSGKKIAGADASELHTLGLALENEDPLFKNMAYVGTMNCSAKDVGNWITPTICPHAQENCCSMNGQFSSMNWETVAKADELELLR